MILITGATGFVGSNLIEFLNENSYVTTPVNLRQDNWKRLAPRSATAIIHLAGKAHDLSNSVNEDEYFRVNCDLTMELFYFFLASDIRDFFFFSSVKAVTDSVDIELFEDVDEIPKTPYGRSKLKAEKLLLNTKLPSGKRLFIIRPCMIHGPGNKGNLNLLFKVVKNRIPWPLTNFENQRSFLSIDNLTYLTRCLMENPNIESGVYNFADDESMSTNDLVRLIGRSVGITPRFLNVPRVLIERTAKIGNVLNLPLNTDRLKKLTDSFVVSNKKIKNALGIEKLPMCLKSGLEKTFKSFITNS